MVLLKKALQVWKLALPEDFFGQERICVAMSASAPVEKNSLEWIKKNSCFHFVEIAPRLDRYTRYSLSPVAWSPWGRKSGPNFQFFKVISAIQKCHAEEWILQLEPDAVPLRKIEHQDFESCIEREAEHWVVGSVHAPLVIDALRGHWTGHLNGVAFYRTGNPEFIDFFLDTWVPTLLLALNSDDSFAYDMVTDPSFSQKVSNAVLQRAWAASSHRFKQCPQMINLSGRELSEDTVFSQISMLADQNRGNYFPWLLHVHSSNASRIFDYGIRKKRFLLDVGRKE